MSFFRFPTPIHRLSSSNSNPSCSKSNPSSSSDFSVANTLQARFSPSPGGHDFRVILYKLFGNAVGSSSKPTKKWIYVGYVKAHTHDVRALVVAIPISREDLLPKDKIKIARSRAIPLDFSYNKWAHMGIPMLISAGDNTKLFAYSANEFTKFAPHDIFPAPQRPLIQLVCSTVDRLTRLLLVQASHSLDIFIVHVKRDVSNMFSGPCDGLSTTERICS